MTVVGPMFLAAVLAETFEDFGDEDSAREAGELLHEALTVRGVRLAIADDDPRREDGLMPDVKDTTTEYATRIHNTDGTHLDGEPMDRKVAEMARDGLNMDDNADFRARRGIDRSELVSRVVTDYVDGSKHLTAWKPTE